MFVFKLSNNKFITFSLYILFVFSLLFQDTDKVLNYMIIHLYIMNSISTNSYTL